MKNADSTRNKACTSLLPYIDAQLDDRAKQEFESHLSGCPRCAQELEWWASVHHKVAVWDEVTSFPGGSPSEEAALLARRGESRRWSWPMVLVPAATAAAAVALTLIIGAPTVQDAPVPGETAPRISSDRPSDEIAVSLADGMQITAPADQTLVFHHQRDRLALGANASVVVEKMHGHQKVFRLLKGVVACEVEERPAGESFVINAGESRVTVVGTRFAVALDESQTLDVVVEKGVVEVARADNRHERIRLAANRQLRSRAEAPPTEIAAAPNAVEAVRSLLAGKTAAPGAAPTLAPQVSPVDGEAVARPINRRSGTGQTGKKADTAVTGIDQAEALIAEGRYPEALPLLLAAVKAQPKNGAAWLLLADCQRKMKRWNDAIDSYEKSTRHLGAKASARASYKMAQIYSKRLKKHPQAIELFEEYLRSGHVSSTLRDVATVDLARSLIAVGRHARARVLLEKVIADQGDSFLASNARHLLGQIEQ